jgi:hypothetical protein
MHFRRLHWALAIVILAAVAVSGQVQKTAGDWNDWETITPEGEEFTVSMPKNPTTETTKFPYHKMELNARSYLATQTGGPVFAIVSLNGIKSNAGSDFVRFNSYIDAFKDYFPPKVRTKDTAITKLVLVSSRPFHGHTGRQYKVSIGELNGVAHAFATRKRFYVVISLNTKNEDLQDKFLSSFVLPERQPEPKVAANAESPENAGQQQTAENAEKPLDPNAQTGTEGNTENEKPNNANKENNKPDPKKPINGGMLNRKAIYLPQPEVSGEATGVVLVQVLIDEQGTVIEAKAVSGPQNLHAAAVAAAQLARFTPTTFMGEPVKVAGTISYNFGKSN